MKLNQFLENLTQYIVSLPRSIYLVVIAIISAIAQFIHITKADIWHDEGYTMMLIPQGVIEIIERTARDVHPPLYYLTAHVWQGIFGMSEVAVRSLSAVFVVATVIVAYLFMRRVFSEGTARFAGLFVALGPFVVRYGEEARMYAMAAFLVTLASYLMVRIATAKKPTRTLWLLYALTIAAGLYTHYYTLFIVPVHMIYLAWQRGGIKLLIRDKDWWFSHALGALLFLPWAPTVLAQMSRVSAGFWIPPTTLETPANTFTQFIAFSSSYTFGWVSGALLTLCVIGVLHTYISRHSLRKPIGLLALWLVLPLAAVILLSIVRPIYYDRYFVYCAVALYLLLAVIFTRGVWFVGRPLLQYGAILGVCGLFIAGINSVGQQASHQMGTIGAYVSEHYQPGDALISGELYTYFDFSYYIKTTQQLQLLSGPLSGYGETSLLYDREEDIVVASLDDVTSERVWIIGKPGEKEYYTSKIPDSWQLVDQVEVADSAVRLYRTSVE